MRSSFETGPVYVVQIFNKDNSYHLSSSLVHISLNVGIATVLESINKQVGYTTLWRVRIETYMKSNNLSIVTSYTFHKKKPWELVLNHQERIMSALRISGTSKQG